MAPDYFATFPDRLDPTAECPASVATMKRFGGLLNTLSADQVRKAQVAQDAFGVSKIFLDAILNG